MPDRYFPPKFKNAQVPEREDGYIDAASTLRRTAVNIYVVARKDHFSRGPNARCMTHRRIRIVRGAGMNKVTEFSR